MSHPDDVSSTSSPPPLAAGARGLVRWVCTNNPFYVLSALLVCLGLWVSFGKPEEFEQTWALMLGMAGYTLLLAVTACLLVRSLGVWDDVRTVLLLVVLMLVATSVTFDEVLTLGPRAGAPYYLGGLLFAIGVSEGILRGIRLALPACFRIPYDLILALFFLYPLALSPMIDRPRSEALEWALFGFSAAAGLVFLTLLPAIHRGRESVRENGSPWCWPLYPWTLFGLLGFAVMGRAYLLCWSMQHLDFADVDSLVFGPYFLIPFLFAVALLLLEIGLVEGRRGPIRAALALPPILVVLAVVGHRPDDVFQDFLATFSARLGGSPLYLTLVASVAFYAFAALRRVPMATGALTATFAALAVFGPASLTLHDQAGPRPVPILAIAAIQLGLGLRRRESWRCLAGAGCLLASAILALPESGPVATTHRGPIAFHLALATVLIVGAAFRDPLGRLLRTVGATIAMLVALLAIGGRLDLGDQPAWVANVSYPLAICVLLAGYGWLLRHRTSLALAAIAFSCWLVAFGWRGYSGLRHAVAGLDYIALGFVFFGLAALISVAKGGVLPGGTAWLLGKVPQPIGGDPGHVGMSAPPLSGAD